MKDTERFLPLHGVVPVFRKGPDCTDKGDPLRTVTLMTYGFWQRWVVPRWTRGLSTMDPGSEEGERVASPSCAVDQSEGLRSVVLLLVIIFISHSCIRKHSQLWWPETVIFIIFCVSTYKSAGQFF